MTRLHAPRILFDIAGRPPQDGCSDVDAHCVACALHHARTASYAKWQGANFTDQNRLRGTGLSDRICEPCVWAHAWTPPPGYPAPSGAERGVNLRLFSHLWSEDDGYVYANKGDKAAMRQWLARPKRGAWFASIADSGQKHVLPWCPVNADGRGRMVRFEQADLPIGDMGLVDVFGDALTAGVTKAEIASGVYTPRSWDIASDAVRELVRMDGLRGPGWWSLALWLAQRDESEVNARMERAKEESNARRGEGGRGARRSRGDGGRREGRVPGVGRDGAQALGPDSRGPRDGAEGERQRGADGDGLPPLSAPGRAVEQLGLFDRVSLGRDGR